MSFQRPLNPFYTQVLLQCLDGPIRVHLISLRLDSTPETIRGVLRVLTSKRLAACTDDMARATPTGRAWVQRDKGGADVH
jgi:hypothetical protein